MILLGIIKFVIECKKLGHFSNPQVDIHVFMYFCKSPRMRCWFMYLRIKRENKTHSTMLPMSSNYLKITPRMLEDPCRAPLELVSV